jgi:hypothetical protein
MGERLVEHLVESLQYRNAVHMLVGIASEFEQLPSH